MSLPASKLFIPTVAYRAGVAEARSRFGRPLARMEGAGQPSGCVMLREFRGAVILPPGPPRFAGNVWLEYPGRRWAVTARSETLLCDRDENPAWGIGSWLSDAVDPGPEPRHDGGPVTRPADRTPLVIDGAGCAETSRWEDGGLNFRAALVGRTYYMAICPLGREGQARLVTA